MKVVSVKSEIKALISICNGKPEIQNKLLSKLRWYHFGYEPAQAIFNRIARLAAESKPIPGSALLAEDITLDEEAKLLLKKEVKPIKLKGIENLYGVLENYRKLRIMSEALAEAADKLTGKDAKNIDQINENLLDKLALAKTDNDIKFSTNRNNKANIERILGGERSIVPTGWEAFDSINGGFLNGQVIVLAANSGGGKSLVMNQLAINQYRMGYSPQIVSFEMDEDEMWQRALSNITKIPHDKFLLKQLNEKQKKKVWKVAKKFRDHGIKNKCSFNVLDLTTKNLRFSEIVYLIKHKKIDILYIDYISLLKPEIGKKETHEQLGEIAKLAKKVASTMRIPVVLLAQLNQEDQIKYSGGINENAGLSLIWRFDERAVADRQIEMRITKARNQRKFDFRLEERFDIMRIHDLDPEKAKEALENKKRQKRQKEEGTITEEGDDHPIADKKNYEDM